MKTLKYFLIPFPFFLSYLIFGFVYFGDHSMMMPLTLMSAFLISYYFSRKSQTKKETLLKLSLAISPLWITMFTTLFFGSMVPGAVLYCVTIPLFSFLGYVYSKKERNTTPLLVSILAFFIGIYALSNSFVVYYNNDARINTSIPDISFYNEQGNEIELDSNKVIALDFWTSSCGYCFQKMPELDLQYLSFKDNPKVEIYSVGAPFKTESIKELDSIMDSLDYSFPEIYVKSTDEVEKHLNQNGYPFLLIIYKGKMRYLGGFNSDKEVKFYRLEDEIERLLEE